MANGKVVAKMDHLACFLPGLLALGAWQLKSEDETTAAADLALAKQLAATCWAMYSHQPSGEHACACISYGIIRRIIRASCVQLPCFL